MLSDAQTPGTVDQGYPLIRAYQTSVYPLSETHIITCFVRAPEVKLIKCFKNVLNPKMKENGRLAEMTTIITTIKRMTNLEICVT